MLTFLIEMEEKTMRTIRANMVVEDWDEGEDTPDVEVLRELFHFSSSKIDGATVNLMDKVKIKKVTVTEYFDGNKAVEEGY